MLTWPRVRFVEIIKECRVQTCEGVYCDIIRASELYSSVKCRRMQFNIAEVECSAVQGIALKCNNMQCIVLQCATVATH